MAALSREALLPNHCTKCEFDDFEDEDCICGGYRTLEAELRGLEGAIEYWREQYQKLRLHQLYDPYKPKDILTTRSESDIL